MAQIDSVIYGENLDSIGYLVLKKIDSDSLLESSNSEGDFYKTQDTIDDFFKNLEQRMMWSDFDKDKYFNSCVVYKLLGKFVPVIGYETIGDGIITDKKEIYLVARDNVNIADKVKNGDMKNLKIENINGLSFVMQNGNGINYVPKNQEGDYLKTHHLSVVYNLKALNELVTLISSSELPEEYLPE